LDLLLAVFNFVEAWRHIGCTKRNLGGGKMIKINLLKPKWSGWLKRYWPHYDFVYDGKVMELRDCLKQTNGPMTQSWVPATCKLKSIPSPPKPKDMSDDEWKTLHDMINGR
jgi:hypothetical protein